VAAVAVLVILSLGWGLQHAALANPPVLGKTAPDLTIQAGAGYQVRVADLRGRPVVLNFWASWCQPCVEEADVLSAAAGTHSNVAFLGADNRDTAAAFQSFEDQHRHTYPAGPIVAGSYQSYGVSGLPATFFIDSKGLVVASFTGPLSTKLLDHYIALIGQ
jgi:cytochrome c biogenesis protein CcmG/thiol:disulfide interchange protein DsbE